MNFSQTMTSVINYSFPGSLDSWYNPDSFESFTVKTNLNAEFIYNPSNPNSLISNQSIVEDITGSAAAYVTTSNTISTSFSDTTGFDPNCVPAVPEPSAVLMVAASAVGMLLFNKIRKNKKRI
jgi:hypothetical protein